MTEELKSFQTLVSALQIATRRGAIELNELPEVISSLDNLNIYFNKLYTEVDQEQSKKGSTRYAKVDTDIPLKKFK